MNEHVDLNKILKDCPKGWKFWSPFFGEVEFDMIQCGYIIVTTKDKTTKLFNTDGTITIVDVKSEEIMLFPSKEQKDWSKFTAPWYKQEKKTERFDPKTLKPFDKVIIRHDAFSEWEASLFSHRNTYYGIDDLYSFRTVTDRFVDCCIPYNDETKHLVGTYDKVPEFYRYWED